MATSAVTCQMASLHLTISQVLISSHAKTVFKGNLNVAIPRFPLHRATIILLL